MRSQPVTFRAYLRAIRNQPAFWLKVCSAGSFGLATLIEKGAKTLLVLIAIVAAIAVIVLYPYFRRHPDRWES